MPARHRLVSGRSAVGKAGPMTPIAFLGTGTMGFPMARNLARAGLDMRAWNRSRERADPLADEGVVVCASPQEAAQGSAVIVTMLSDTTSVLESAEPALESAGRDVIWVQMSTIGEAGIQRCQDLAERAGVALVDAPVLGTREPAEDKKLIVLASGPEEARARCQPVFDAVGRRTLWLGEAGRATRAKLVVNSWVLGVTGLIAETISLSEALEIDPHVFFEAIEGGTLDLPYAQLKGKAMIERAFDDAAFRLSLARKDSDLVLDAARSASLETPILEAVAQRLATAEAAGHGDEDMAANFWATVPQAGSRQDG
jgi:3-hydroxyisobutyrate dehydrogenase